MSEGVSPEQASRCGGRQMPPDRRPATPEPVTKQAAGRLIVVGGLPGTGKTTLSQVLAPELGAVYLRGSETQRRRVEARVPDLNGQVVPTWADVVGRQYVPWDESRDGPRVLVDMTNTSAGLALARQTLAAT